MDDVLYTIVPNGEIFPEDNTTSANGYQDILYNNIHMQVEPVEWNKFKIIRLYSTDPAHYLEPTLQPGSIINI